MTSNSALERTAGSHALAAAAHRNVRRTCRDPRSRTQCNIHILSGSSGPRSLWWCRERASARPGCGARFTAPCAKEAPPNPRLELAAPVLCGTIASVTVKARRRSSSAIR
jgi:hypothetical protein